MMQGLGWRRVLVALSVLFCFLAVAQGDTAPSPAAARSIEAPESGPLNGKLIWYMDVVDSNPLIVGIAQAIYLPIRKAGGQMVRSVAVNQTTGQLDLSVQSQAFDRAIAAHPAAIIYFVLDAKSLKPQVQRAEKAGIPVFAVFGKPQGFKVNAYILLADYRQGYISASYLARKLPRGAQVTILAGPPTPNVEAELTGARAALKKAGVNLVGSEDQQRNLTDNPSGGQQVMQGILQRFPNVQGVFVYNDDSALGAIAAAKAAHRKVLITSRNGSQDAINSIKKGNLLATCDINPIAIGRNVGRAVVSQLEGTKHYTGDFKLPSPDPSTCLVTKANVNRFKPWNQRIKYVKIAER